MPISSYPRITLQGTSFINNPPSGTGLCILDNNGGQYIMANSDLFPINEGGLAANDSLYSDLGIKIPNLLVDSNDNTAANLLQDIRDTLGIIQSNLANGTYAIQIQASNSTDRAHLTANRLDVRVG